VKGAGADFKIQRLQDHAALPGPEMLQGENKALKGINAY
jgi:hypothetical protein